MKKVPVKFALVAVLLLAGGYWYWRSRPSLQDVAQKVFNGKQVFEAFVTSQTATAQRLHWRRQEGQDSRMLSNYDQDSPVTIPPTRAQEIQALLQRPASYAWRYKHRCIVDYGTLLTFHSGKRNVRVALCFKCNELGIFDGEDNNAVRINTIDVFDPIRKQLVAIVKSIYPTDVEIGALK